MVDTVKTSRNGKGRPPKYANDDERKAARAAAARKRRAKEKEQGMKEVRRMVKVKTERPHSTVIDLSAIYNNKR